MNTSPRFLLRIPEMLFQEMVAQAIAELPNECCGLLAGHIQDGRIIADVTHRYPLINALQSPTEFVSEPDNMLAAMRDMRQQKTDVLAVYHSHPSSDPVPSQRDRERRYSSGVMDLIIGCKKGVTDVRGWWLSDSSFEIAMFEVVRFE